MQVKRKITQETFEAVVRENIDDFEMDREEAVKDAIQQFTSQNVDLSNVVISYSDSADHYKNLVFEKIQEILQTSQAIEGLQTSPEGQLDLCQGKILETLDFMLVPFEEYLKSKMQGNSGKPCHDDSSTCCSNHGSKSTDGKTLNVKNDLGIIREEIEDSMLEDEDNMEIEEGLNKKEVGKEGLSSVSQGTGENLSILKTAIYSSLLIHHLFQILNYVDMNGDKEIVLNFELKILKLIQHICSNDQAEKDIATSSNMTILARMIQSHNSWLSSTTDSLANVNLHLSLLVSIFTTIKILCTKTEDNKVNFANGDGLIHLVYALKNNQNTKALVVEGCAAIKAVTAVDDFRKDFSASHIHTKLIVKNQGISILASFCKYYESDLGVVSAALGALRNLANNQENVRNIVKEGGLTCSVSAIKMYENNLPLMRNALGLLRNISADDEHKDGLVNDCSVAILHIMTVHAKDIRVQEHGLACLAALMLRSPENCSILVSKGVVPVTSTAMRIHANSPTLLRQACLAVRNLVARNPELKDPILDSGMESQLRDAGKYQDCVDEAYAAIRDLGLEVKRVAINKDTGEVEEAVHLFGAKPMNFRPVYDATDELEKNVDSAITKPSEAYNF